MSQIGEFKMNNMSLFCKIYELKGMLSSLLELAEEDDHCYNPMVEKMDSIMKDIIQEVEKMSA